MTAPKIHLLAYEWRQKGKVFVSVPDETARWMLTDRCVIEVPCSYCGSMVCEPCKSMRGYMIDTHYQRRREWRHLNRSATRDKPRVRVMAVLGSEAIGQEVVA